VNFGLITAPRSNNWVRYENGATSNLVQPLIQFLEDQTKHVAAVEAAIAEKDPLALRKAAHSLKGSSLNVGARALASSAMELEKLGMAGTLEGVEELLAVFQKECRRARRALEQRLDPQSVGSA